MSKFSLSIIGSGNVASHLAQTFYDNGIKIKQIFSKHFHNATILADKVESKACIGYDQIDDDIDFLIIAISDSEIENVICEIPDNINAFVIHTSGSIDISVFKNRFKNYGVLYPLQTLSQNSQLVNSNFPYLIEANSIQSLQKLTDLVHSITSNFKALDSNQRLVVHLAAVFANNFTNHLLTLSNEILASEELSFEMIKPLLMESFMKIQNHLPENVQTGPAKRGDFNVIKKHEEILKRFPDNFHLIYDSITSSIIDKYKSNG